MEEEFVDLCKMQAMIEKEIASEMQGHRVLGREKEERDREREWCCFEESLGESKDISNLFHYFTITFTLK